MRRGIVAVLVVLSLVSVTGCVKNNRDEFCRNHPNNAKCR